MQGEGEGADEGVGEGVGVGARRDRLLTRPRPRRGQTSVSSTLRTLLSSRLCRRPSIGMGYRYLWSICYL